MDDEDETAPEAHRKQVVKQARDGRLVWFRAKADPEFWHDYFLANFSHDLIEGYRAKRLERDALGRILAGNLPREGTVLEAGSGAGYWLATLQGNGFDVEGVEWSQKLVDRVLEVAPDLPMRQGDVTALDVPDGRYVGYVSLGVVEHREEGPEPFLDEAFRVLAPGGVAVISVPMFGLTRRLKARLGRYRRPVGDLPFYQYAYRAAEIRDYVAGAGFQVTGVATYSFDRMLREEAPRVSRLVSGRLRGPLMAAADRFLSRSDGHMVAVIATKPPTS